MKKRVLSMLLAFILCFSTLPMTAFAQEADAVTEQEEQQEAAPAAEPEEQQEADSAEEQKEAEAVAAPGEETSSDKSTTAATPGTEDPTAGEVPDTVKSTGESISDNDAGTQDTAADDEKKAAVQKVQALIDALPETVTMENAESVSAQLEAIDEAMESLTEEQIAELDMTRLHAVSEAMNAPMTVAAGEHTHFLCGKDTCNRVGGHTETTKVTFQAWNGTSELPEVVGNYYLMNNVTLSEAWTPVDGVVLCLNGYNITLAYSNDCIIPKTGSTFTLCDCQNGGKITHSNGYRGSGAFVAGGSTFNMYGGSSTGNTARTGAGVRMYNNGTFNMYGGNITGNEAKNFTSNSENVGIGGGVCMEKNSTFNMYAGTISNNTGEYGGGVYSYDVAGGNYNVSGSTTFTIEKADYTNTVTKTVNLIKGRSTAQEGTLMAADFFTEEAVPEGAVISNVEDSFDEDVVKHLAFYQDARKISYTSAENITSAIDQTCTVTISSANYQDIKATLTFHPTDKETVTISGLTYTGKTYDGKAMEPAGTLQVSGDKVPVSELEVTYAGTGSTSYNNSKVAPTDAGTYKVTYKVPDSNENYTGKMEYNFTIRPKMVTADMIGTIDTQTYTGSAIMPQPVVKDLRKELTSGKDFTFGYDKNTNAGVNTATLTITGQGNYTGTANKTFAIAPKNLQNASITLQTDSLVYTGSTQTVQITSVKLDGVLLTTNDYAIANDSNKFISANDAITLTIAGMGNYTGTAATTWQITKARPELGNFDVSPNLSTPLTYDGTPKTVTAQPRNGVIGMGAVTVCYEGNNGTTYARSETAPTNAGTYNVILSVVEGKNYTAVEIEAGTLTIKKADLTVGDVTEFFEYTKTGAQTISLAELVPRATNYAPGTYTDVNGILTGDLTIDATGLMKFTLSALTIANIDNKVTVPVTITSDNYKDVTVNVTIYISPEYRIIDGAGSSWTQNTTGTVVIRGNGEYDRFRNVKVDGKVIDSDNYIAEKGSTIITLKAEYLKTLATGSHTFAIVWDNGIAGTSFTVAANTSGNHSGNNNNNDSNHGSDNSGNNDSGNTAGTAANTAAASAQELDKVPATGDASGIWLALFAVSLSGWAVMMVLKRKPGQKGDPK